MGKYMRKNKMGGTVVDISLGVRTRARTLQLKKQEQQQAQQQQRSMNVLNFCYLELRSRKLEKVFFKATAAAATAAPRPPSSSSQLKKQQSRRVSAVRSEASVEAFVSISRASSYLANSPKQDCEKKQLGEATTEPELRTAELEASCGDNVFDQDANSSRDSFGTEHFRRVREGTPLCSSKYELVEAPGSSSRPQVHSLSHHTRTGSSTAVVPRAATAALTSGTSPTQEEIEDFFAELEDAEAKRQSDRYNYDFLNDVPLAGRFEWTVEQPAGATVDSSSALTKFD